ncbi:MAG: VWA domain-containing protein [Bryobacterales bacterium]|nr:VWA domain-containing protein [Bryobacterales bacterium]
MRCLLPALAGMALLGQQTTSQQQDDVIRITVNLVQVDAVVTDAKGRHITGLEAADFELLQDGKPQKITSFQFVRSAAPSVTAPKPADPSAPPAPPVALKPDQIQRTIAVVVDDLNMSWESMAYAQQAMKKFVDEKIQQGDLVAVVRTGAGMGALQSFTADKRQMLAAVERVKWNPLGRGGVSAFGNRDEEEEEAFATLDNFRDRIFSVGTLGAINYVVNGLRELPGRKSVVLVSDGMRILDSDGNTDMVLEQLRRLTDLANRAGVVIYTLDSRMLPTLQPGANERGPSDPNPVTFSDRMSRRRSDYFESQNGLHYLANETGGIFYRDSNDIAGSLAKVLEDQQGYYLLGYSPGEATFNKSYHKVQVKVKRAGLTVRSRTGFLGIPDSNARPARKTRQQQMLAALTSPFGSGGVPIKLTALYSENAKGGSYVSSLLHIDVSQLPFQQDAEGWHKATIDALVITFGDNGIPIDESDKTFTINLRGNTYRQALANGLTYTIHHPIKKPGAYQLRAVIRDASSGKAGSASQFIEVPDVKKGRLALSGLYLRSPADKAQMAEGQQLPQDPRANPIVRSFRQGQTMLYIFQVLNARMDGDKKPRVDIQATVFRDGKQVFAGKTMPYEPGAGFDPKRMLTAGQLRLGREMTPGEYMLLVKVTDKLAPAKRNTAVQWMDFVLTGAEAAAANQ